MQLSHITPMLEAKNLTETIEFYTKTLGFTCASVWPQTGEPCWTCLKKDSIEIMFTSKNSHSKLEGTVMTGSLYLYSEPVDKFWEELKDKVTVEYPIENFEYGMREFAIRDCNGYLLQFGQEIPH